MPVLLPFSDIIRTPEVLDSKHLWLQVVECKRVLGLLRDIHEGAVSLGTTPHPEVMMWWRHEHLLGNHMAGLFHEVGRRGGPIEWDKFKPIYEWSRTQGSNDPHPEWWGGPIHYTHRVKLCEKDWDHYNGLFPDVMDTDVGTLDCHWPKPHRPDLQDFQDTATVLGEIRHRLVSAGKSADGLDIIAQRDPELALRMAEALYDHVIGK